MQTITPQNLAKMYPQISFMLTENIKSMYLEFAECLDLYGFDDDIDEVIDLLCNMINAQLVKQNCKFQSIIFNKYCFYWKNNSQYKYSVLLDSDDDLILQTNDD